MQVHLMVGEPFHFEFERELQDYMTPHFMLYSQTDSTNLLTLMKDSASPVLKTVVNFSGLGLVEMQRNASTIEEKPGAFQKYLAEEKITGIEFDSVKWKKPVVNERYSRCIKSLVTSGKPGSENLFSKVTGQKLELVLLTNPYALSPGQHIAVKLLWEGKPIAGMWITASIQKTGGAISTVTAMTDKKGLASFESNPDAIYYLNAVHMMKLKEGSAMDYESVWASYSFQAKMK